MAERNPFDAGDGGSGEVNTAAESYITPRIADVEPLAMSCDYQLPWERQSNQTACGRTIQYQGGDKNWRVVIEGIITIDQFQRLNELRGLGNVSVRTAELGEFQITFDQLNITRSDKQAVGDIDEGEVKPLLEFQLQSKQEDESDQDPPVEFVNE